MMIQVCLVNLSHSFRQQDQPKVARDMLTEALQIQEKRFGQGSPATAAIHVDLGELCAVILRL
jgi:hypothetical protein